MIVSIFYLDMTDLSLAVEVLINDFVYVCFSIIMIKLRPADPGPCYLSDLCLYNSPGDICQKYRLRHFKIKTPAKVKLFTGLFNVTWFDSYSVKHHLHTGLFFPSMLLSVATDFRSKV